MGHINLSEFSLPKIGGKVKGSIRLLLQFFGKIRGTIKLIALYVLSWHLGLSMSRFSSYDVRQICKRIHDSFM